MTSADRIRLAAEELQAALAGYDPRSMRQLVRDLPAVGAALGQVGDGLHAVATRAEGQWPAAAAVTDGLYSMASDLRAAADTAEVADAFTTHHSADIERHDAPRGGSRAVEARWDVGRPGADDGGAGRHRTAEPATQEATVATGSNQPTTSRRGGFHPDQPRAADGKWIKVGDVLGYADGDTCHGTDRVAGTGTVPTTLALMDYSGTDEGGGQYVVLATPRSGRWNPLTWREEPGPGDESPSSSGYAAPQLSPREAADAAKHLDELADLADAGYRPPKPTRYSRAAQHLQHLVDVKDADPRDKIGVGNEDEFPLTVKELLALLREKDPVGSAATTRRKVAAAAIGEAGGDTGIVWMDLETGADGARVVVTAVEGTETPDSDYNRQYASRLDATGARELAAKLRAFTRSARSLARSR